MKSLLITTLSGSSRSRAASLLISVLSLSAAYACTPASEDPLSDGSAGQTASGAGGANASGGSLAAGGFTPTGSGGAPSAGGSGGSPSTSSGGAAGSSGAPSASGAPGASGSTSSGGAAGYPGAGGAAPSAGAPSNGGSTSVAGAGGGGGATTTGCNWTAPEGKVVLFDGTNLDQWKSKTTGGSAPWKLQGDGTMEVVSDSGDIQTKSKFEDLCVHLEYLTPMYASSVTGQDRGNSGVYLKSAYEMQILDSVGQPPDTNTCGAVYSISAPLTVACNRELVWNTYEIEFKASVWDSAGKKTKNAVMVSATLNGKLVQRNVDLNPAGGRTQSGVADAAGPQPLMLQDHNNNVQFRNIWVMVPR